MKQLRVLLAILMAFTLIFSLASCGKKQEEVTTGVYQDTPPRDDKTVVAAYIGSTAAGLAHAKATREYSMDIDFYDDVGTVYDLIKNGKADIAGLPLNMAAKLYNETNGGVKILSVSSIGGLFLIHKEGIAESVSDIKGTTIYTAYKGSSFSWYVENLLSLYGIDPANDVEIVYLDTYQDVVKKAESDDAPDVCILPANLAAITVENNEAYTGAINLKSGMDSKTETDIALECIVVRNDYLESHPEYVDEFVLYDEMSVNFLKSNLKSGSYLVSAGIFPDEEMALSGITSMYAAYIISDEMKEMVNSTFEMMYESNPTLLGGKIPDDGIFA